MRHFLCTFLLGFVLLHDSWTKAVTDETKLGNVPHSTKSVKSGSANKNDEELVKKTNPADEVVAKKGDKTKSKVKEIKSPEKITPADEVVAKNGDKTKSKDNIRGNDESSEEEDDAVDSNDGTVEEHVELDEDLEIEETDEEELLRDDDDEIEVEEENEFESENTGDEVNVDDFWPAQGQNFSANRNFGHFSYISPLPRSEYVSPYTTIAVRSGDLLSEESAKRGTLHVINTITKQAVHIAKVDLLQDKKTLHVTFTDKLDSSTTYHVKVFSKMLLKATDAATDAGAGIRGIHWSFKTAGNRAQFFNPKISTEQTNKIPVIHMRPLEGPFLDARKFMSLWENPGDVPQFFFRDNRIVYDAAPVSSVDEEQKNTASYRKVKIPNIFGAKMKSFKLAPYLTRGYRTVLMKNIPRIRLSVGPTAEAKPGFIFTTNNKAGKQGLHHPFLLILDATGDLVFFVELPAVRRPLGRNNWEIGDDGNLQLCVNFGDVPIQFNSRYEIIRRWASPNGYFTNPHGIQFQNGSALMLSKDIQEVSVNGKSIPLDAAIVHVVDKMGRSIFEWRMWDHISPETMYSKSLQTEKCGGASTRQTCHPNMVSWSKEGNIVLSTRYLGVWKISRWNGRVIWRFGQMWNDFKSVNFRDIPVIFQQDAHLDTSDNVLIALDNGNDLGCSPANTVPIASRMVEYRLDEKKMTATRVFKFSRNNTAYSAHNGSVQRIRNKLGEFTGNRGICWGGTGAGPHGTKIAMPFFTEVTPKGKIAIEMYFENGANAYSSRKVPVWEARPFWLPQLIMSEHQLHFSWNGATVVRKWRILVDTVNPPKKIHSVVKKTRFEHEIKLPVSAQTKCSYFRAVALDGDDGILKLSAVVPSKACTLSPKS